MSLAKRKRRRSDEAIASGYDGVSLVNLLTIGKRAGLALNGLSPFLAVYQEREFRTRAHLVQNYHY